MNSLIPVAAAVAMFGFIWYAIRMARKHKAERERVCQELGFTKVDQVPSDFAARIQALHSFYKGKTLVYNLFIRGCGRFDLYVFDLMTGGKSDHRERMAAIVSHDLELPAFRLFPAMPFSGVVANWLNKLVVHMASKQGFTEYRATTSSRFSEKYRLYVADVVSVQQSVPDTVWSKLADMEPLMTIEGQDDLLIFGTFNGTKTTPFRSTDPEEHRAFLRSVMEQGGRLHRIFSEARRLQPVH